MINLLSKQNEEIQSLKNIIKDQSDVIASLVLANRSNNYCPDNSSHQFQLPCKTESELYKLNEDLMNSKKLMILVRTFLFKTTFLI